MARLFDDSLNQNLSNSIGLVQSYPLTIAAWFRSDDVVNNQTIVSIDNNGVEGGFARLAVMGAVSGDPVRAQSQEDSGTGATGSADTTTGYSSNTWHHAVGVFSSATARASYIDGGSKGTNATSIPMTTSNSTYIGNFTSWNDGSLLQFFSGRIAEVSVWNEVLTDGEVNALAKGASPLKIRPSNLVAYWPLYGLNDPERNIISSSNALTNSGTTQVDGPPLTQPPFISGRQGWFGTFTTATSGTLFTQSVSGSIAATGILNLTTTFRRVLTGSISATGTLFKKMFLLLSGSSTATGTVSPSDPFVPAPEEGSNGLRGGSLAQRIRRKYGEFKRNAR